MSLIKLLAIFIIISQSIAKEPLCNHFLCTSTQKTLVRFYSSSGNNTIDRIQPDIWQKAKNEFSDYKSISFTEIDCDEKPEACYNFPNEKIPSYVFLHDELLTAVCIQPQNYLQMESYCMELLGTKYQRKKDWVVYEDICETVYPEIKGNKIVIDKFNSSIECGHHFVIFYQPKCIHCKKIIARWNKLTILYPHLNFGVVKCEKEKEREFCSTQKAIGFPTLNMYIDGVLKEEYGGSDDTAQFKEFLDGYLQEKSKCVISSPSVSSSYESLLN